MELHSIALAIAAPEQEVIRHEIRAWGRQGRQKVHHPPLLTEF